MPSVSIIIPAYKQARYLPQAIDSALEQSYLDREVIVVDDGSPDETETVCRRYGEKIRYIRKENSGVSAARNTGILASSGDFIQFLDADDYLPPSTLEAHMRQAALRPEGGVFYGGSYLMNAATERIDKNQDYDLPEFPSETFRHLLLGNNFPPHAAIVRRSALENAGLWDTQLHYFEDWDMWLRLAFSGAIFIRTSGAYVGYRRHEGGATKYVERMRAGAMQVLDKAELYTPRSSATRRAIANGRWNCRRHILRQILTAETMTATDGKEKASGSTSRLSALLRGLRSDPAMAVVHLRDLFKRMKWGVLRLVQLP